MTRIPKKKLKAAEKTEGQTRLERQHADIKKYRGVSTTYDQARPKRQVVTRYTR